MEVERRTEKRSGGRNCGKDVIYERKIYNFKYIYVCIYILATIVTIN